MPARSPNRMTGCMQQCTIDPSLQRLPFYDCLAFRRDSQRMAESLLKEPGHKFLVILRTPRRS